MGYYTNYKFSIHSYGNKEVLYPGNGTLQDKDVAYKILEMSKGTDRFYPLVQEIKDNGGADYFTGQDGLYLEYGESVKWYEHDKDMRELSLEFPELTFKLHGNGEDADDVWNAYYRNGKSCRYEPIMPDFDENDLR